MRTRQTRAVREQAAKYLADLILDSLSSFPEEERQKRLKDIYRALDAGAKRRRNTLAAKKRRGGG